MTEQASPRTERFLFIDLYRSAVILLMLEGHTFRTFLPKTAQQSPLFQFHEFFHGLSAPAFLFGAGLTFVISTRRRWEEYHHWGPPLARRVKRLILVLLLGLAIHLPYFSFRKIVADGTTADYLQLFQCDVLHCIGLGLLALHGLVFLFKTESRFYGLVLSAIVSVCFLTPLVWDADFSSFPPALSQLMSGAHASPFPLFPYVGFLFAGVIVSWEFMVAVAANRQAAFMRRLTIIGLALIASGVAFDLIPINIYPHYDYWFTSPNYFMVRVGSLLVIISGIWRFARWIKMPAVTVLGKESLFVYVLHLVVLYGSAVNPAANLQTALGQNLSILQTSAIFLAFALTMLLAAFAWSFLREKQFRLYRLIQLAGSALFLYFFYTRDF